MLVAMPMATTVLAQAVDVDLTGSTLADASLVALVGAGVGLVVGLVGTAIVFGFWRTELARITWRRNLVPRLVAAASLGALVGVGLSTGEGDDLVVLRRVLTIVFILALTWYAIALLRSIEESAVRTWDTSRPDNLMARRRRTQFLVLRRAGSAVIVVIGLSAVLLTFPIARSLGQSLLASAGILGIVAGVAAQGSLKNLVAGIQIAVAQPIRLGDAVLVEGEWGTIEDITLTTVVVALWDRRRLVHPTSWFTEQPFQNWTRTEAQLLGQVTLVLDHRADVAALREAAGEIIAAEPRHDGEAWVVQVTEADADGITVRILMTAQDAPTTFDLRCAVREALIAWIVEHDPDALPRRRIVDATPPLGDDRGDRLVPGPLEPEPADRAPTAPPR